MKRLAIAIIILEIIITFVEGDRYSIMSRNYISKGVPDERKLEMKISRGSGTGVISAGYIVVSLLAFGLFAALIFVIICYKPERGIRSDERTLFYA